MGDRRSVGTLALLVALGIAVTPMGGCSSYQPMKIELPESDPAQQEDANVDVPRARASIEKAMTALRAKDLAGVRKHLAEAEPFANDKVREEIRSVRQRADEIEAGTRVPKVLALIDAGKCREAVAEVAKIVDERRGSTVPRFVQKHTGQRLLECLAKLLEQDLAVGRSLLKDAKVKKALDKAVYNGLRLRVTDATVSLAIKRFDDGIAKRLWVQVSKALATAVERGEIGKRERDKIVAIIRKGVAEDAEKRIAEGLAEARGADKALEDVDAMIAAADWVLEPAKGKTVAPPKLQLRRAQLAFWGSCSKVGCRQAEKRKMWVHGAADLRRPLDPNGKGKPKEKMKHARVVWALAAGRGVTLVATADPGDVSDEVKERFVAAAGWVATRDLRKENNAEWLPPGDAIVGTRVWGPLREGQKEFEFGIVRAATRAKVEVERQADGKRIEVSRLQIRYGSTNKGLKVLSRCDHPLKLEPAVLEGVDFAAKGDPVARVQCVDAAGKPNGPMRQTQLGALRTKATWLPRRR
jgi:hypothetical protein